MGQHFGVDLAWGRPGVRALQGIHAEFVVRYFSHDSTGKNLTRSEADAMAAGGIWSVGIWESAAGRANQGHKAGVDDATAAVAQAEACGMPGDRPIYFAVDYDAPAADQPAINAYLDGAHSVLGNNSHGRSRVGVYGSYDVVRRALDGGHAGWGWQTYAWSGGQWDSRAVLQQYSNDHVVNGVGLDYDRATVDDYGQWMPGKSPAVDPGPTSTEDDMPYGQIKNGTHRLEDLTTISLARGRYKSFAAIADNGFQGLLPASGRVAVHTTDDKGKGSWEVLPNQIMDGGAGQYVLTFRDPAHTDGVSFHHETVDEISAKSKDKNGKPLVDVNGAVNVAWQVS